MVQAIPIALSAIGSIVGGIGANKAGKQQQRAYNMEAQGYEVQAGTYYDRARALQGQATEEEYIGNAQALRVRDEARKAIGDQIAGQFSNGFQGGSGSALDALTESQVNSTLDMLELRRQAAGRARAYRVDSNTAIDEAGRSLLSAEQSRLQGKIARSQGKFALAEGIIGAGSSIASGVRDWAAAGKAGG